MQPEESLRDVPARDGVYPNVIDISPPRPRVDTPVLSMHPDTLGYATVPISTFSTPLMMPPMTQASYPGSGLILMTPQPAYVPSEQPVPSAGIPAWNATPKYRGTGDTPFIFLPEPKAATAAKLQAALQFCHSFSRPRRRQWGTITWQTAVRVRHPAFSSSWHSLLIPGLFTFILIVSCNRLAACLN